MYVPYKHFCGVAIQKFKKAAVFIDAVAVVATCTIAFCRGAGAGVAVYIDDVVSVANVLLLVLLMMKVLLQLCYVLLELFFMLSLSWSSPSCFLVLLSLLVVTTAVMLL